MTGVIKLSGGTGVTRVIPCADVATASASPATAKNLIISYSPCVSPSQQNPGHFKDGRCFSLV